MVCKARADRLVMALLAAALVLVAVVLVAPARASAPAQWWDSTFPARETISVTETSGASLKDYQVKVVLPYDPSMQSNFGDVRFSDNSSNVLSYWLDSYTPGVAATFWVKVASLPAKRTTVIYAYYGNPIVSTTSNIHTTFIFGDDFQNPAWTAANIHAVNYSTAAQYVANGLYHQVGQANDEAIAEIYKSSSLMELPDNYVVEVNVEPLMKSGLAQINPRYLSVADKYECLLDAQYNAAGLNEVVGNKWKLLQYRPVGFTVEPGTWYQMKEVTLRQGATNRFLVFVNGSCFVDFADSSLSYSGLAFLSHAWGYPFHMAYSDFTVRQYISSEPSTMVGPKETIRPAPTPFPTGTTRGTVDQH